MKTVEEIINEAGTQLKDKIQELLSTALKDQAFNENYYEWEMGTAVFDALKFLDDLQFEEGYSDCSSTLYKILIRINPISPFTLRLWKAVIV